MLEMATYGYAVAGVVVALAGVVRIVSLVSDDDGNIDSPCPMICRLIFGQHQNGRANPFYPGRPLTAG